MRPLLPLLAALCLAASPAFADERWQTALGPIFWETDIGTTAVLRLEGTDTRFYVEGLVADMAGGRGTYTGIWTAAASDKSCALAVVDPMAGNTVHWGTFRITFVSDAFPSSWAGVMGICLNPPTNPIAGAPE